jgi:succinate dehydrogenase flavin-adding protein (antitoxin of CptAB toxin-antitoxin module)
MRPNDDDMVNWVEEAKTRGCLYVAVMLDLEDKDLFPVYFANREMLQQYCRNLISAMRLELISVLDVEEECQL